MHALEKEMATHSSVLAWRIPGTEEPGGHSFRYMPPQSHQFPVPNGKTGVGGLMFDDRHVADE